MKTQWLTISSQLKDEFDRSVYMVWIAPLSGTVDDTDPTKPILRLKAKSAYAANWIKQKYVSTILAVSTRVLGTKPSIDITVQEEITEYTAEKLVTHLPTAPSILATEEPLLPIEMPPVRLSLQEQLVQRWKHSFDTFVVGPCNQLAYAAASDIVKPTASTEMLFLSSAPGLGKTHLAQSLGKAMYVQSKQHNLSMAYLTSEEFSSQFIQACRFRTLDTFKERFRSLDLLLLEDIHFLRDKEKTQEELLAIVKYLQDNGKKVVFTSSFAPRDLQGLDSQLTSRFCSGFVASMEYPDFETKKAMLMQKAQLRNFMLPESVADLFADKLHGDIRLLESSLNTLILQAQLLNQPLSTDLAYNILAQIAPQNHKLTLEELLKLVCSCYGITEEQIRSTSRKQGLVNARNTAFYLIRKHFSLTLTDIGAHFDKRHSTVSKGITLVESELSKNSRLGAQFQQAISAIEARSAV